MVVGLCFHLGAVIGCCLVVMASIVANVGVFSVRAWELGGVQMLDRHDAVGRSRQVMLGPVLVSEGVARDDGRSDEVTRVRTRAAGMRGWVAVIAKLVFSAWRAGTVLKEGRVLVDVGREAVYRRGCWAASRLKVVLRWRFGVQFATN